MSSPIFVGDYGHVVTLTGIEEDGSVVDDTGATTRVIEVRKPDGTTSDKTAGGSAGVFTWTVTTGTFSAAGDYYFRIKFSGTGFSYKSAWLIRRVLA